MKSRLSYSANNNANKCQAIYFTGNGKYITNDIPRNSLFCVRLVTDYQPSTNSSTK